MGRAVQKNKVTSQPNTPQHVLKETAFYKKKPFFVIT